MHVHICNRIIRILVIIVASFLTWKIFQTIFSHHKETLSRYGSKLNEDNFNWQTNYLGSYETESVLGNYSQYAVSTDAYHCSRVGTRLLKKGGSAMDAAIGTLLCMGIVLPNSMGIGGGCLMTIYDTKSGLATTINGREFAPHYAHENMFLGDPIAASRGNRSVGVPGELAAYSRAHELYGRLNWSSLFEDTIEMAERGVPVVNHLASALRDPRHAIYMSKEMRESFMNEKTGLLVGEGDMLKMKRLAATLRRIRDHGANDFYYGETGRLFIEDLRKQGGLMTMDDLASYRVNESRALSFKITDDLTLHTQPLPGSGLVLNIILKIMRNLGYYGRHDLGKKFEDASLYYHHLTEAFKYAYAQRSGLEDKPDDPARLEALIDKLKSEEFIQYASANIDNWAHDDDRYLLNSREMFAQDGGTAHVSVIDSNGLAVAVTSSINLYFGSGLISKSTGIIYNDIMDDFVSPDVINRFGIRPSQFNRIRPGKRPLSSMTPSIFVDSQNRVRLVVGASGGTHITTGVASTSLNHLFLGQNLKEAVDKRRIHHQYIPNEIVHEANFRPDLIASLRARNHSIRPLTGRSSIVMALANQPDEYGRNQITANSDARKGGSVDGV